MSWSAPIPPPSNEPVLDYGPGSAEKQRLRRRLDEVMREQVEIPLRIGGRDVLTGKTVDVVCPHDHRHILARCHQASAREVEQAITAAGAAWATWSEMPFPARAAVFLKAAELLASSWRDDLNAATMLNQSKTVYQAEIDSACELIDFWRFNPYFAERLFADQPRSPRGVWNSVEYRPLEGFVFAVTPFNFTSIAGNLPTAPALLGNTVVWKPASTALLSGYVIVKLLEEAGLPPGVINFTPGRGADVGDVALRSPELAGIHFTGSTPVFQRMWQTVAGNLPSYRSYPRLVGETGGKDFVFAHPSADPDALRVALVRGAFVYQGQKCSAASRAYVPRSLWPRLELTLREELAELRVGTPLDFRNFMAAVIDRASFDKLAGAIAEARAPGGYQIVAGGGCDPEVGWFVAPTVVRSDDPRSRLMSEELFGPLLTVFVYDDDRLDEALALCDGTSPYALTGAVFAQDRRATLEISRRLRHAAGNFYVNDKPTGAVVGQQPFGGGRASGTNDKAGSALNLLRWVSQRALKENFTPSKTVAYPHLAEE